MEFYFDNPQSAVWLIIGVVFIILEVVAAPGVGLITAGLGAITVGALIAFKIISDTNILSTTAFFLFFTIVWWVVIWKPLKKSISKNSSEYSNYKGTEAIIENDGGLVEGKVGYVKWSGARMRARIHPNSTTTSIENGQQVWVHENKNGILIVDVVEPK